jgi:predicted component of type VI protein secretion system
LHARLKLLDDGSYLLLDNNSIAGTWVNFEPVPLEGYRLAHGDMIHFGQLNYRFALRNPTPVSEPTLAFQKPEE